MLGKFYNLYSTCTLCGGSLLLQKDYLGNPNNCSFIEMLQRALYGTFISNNGVLKLHFIYITIYIHIYVHNLRVFYSELAEVCNISSTVYSQFQKRSAFTLSTLCLHHSTYPTSNRTLIELTVLSVLLSSFVLICPFFLHGQSN